MKYEAFWCKRRPAPLRSVVPWYSGAAGATSGDTSAYFFRIFHELVVHSTKQNAKIYPMDIKQGISCRTASGRTSVNYCERQHRMSHRSEKAGNIIILYGLILKAIPIWEVTNYNRVIL